MTAEEIRVEASWREYQHADFWAVLEGRERPVDAAMREMDAREWTRGQNARRRAAGIPLLSWEEGQRLYETR